MGFKVIKATVFQYRKSFWGKRLIRCWGLSRLTSPLSTWHG